MNRLDRLSKINRVLILTFFLNLSVCTIKIVLGLVTGSITILSDGLHSLGDMFSNVVGMVGIFFARKQNQDTNLGYEKFELIATGVIALVISVTFVEVMINGIDRLLNPHIVVITPIVFVLMGINILVNVAVAWYETNAGKKYKSDLLIADASETKIDVLISLAVMAGVFFMNLGFWWLDGVLSILIGLLILKILFEILMTIYKTIKNNPA
jgi:cation diffusion facilitator family transporter